MNLEDFFQIVSNDLDCNTSYPLKSSFFQKYKTNDDIMKNTSELSLYYHIPFCKHLCSFCEYTRFICDDISQQKYYVDKLISQSDFFLQNHNIKLLHGLDIGGGTPTALDISQLNRLLDYTLSISKKYRTAERFEPSIEFSFSAIDEQKIKCIAAHDIPRMSTGIQIYDKTLLEQMNRTDHRLDSISKYVRIIKDCGIKKLNIDLMYGFTGQTDTVLKNTIYAIKILMPEQVTLYEMRYNRSNLEHNKINRETMYEQYEFLYSGLKELGYKGRFGQNTFSLSDDEGVSSYLYSRMIYGVPYKGFGISAQSMSREGISYNILKNSQSKYLPQFDDIFEEDIYILPKDELSAKYVCISLYSGRFRIDVLNDILCCNAMNFYKKEFDFIINNGYAEIKDDFCQLTHSGFKQYGAIAALFWSAYHKEQYLADKKRS